MVSQTGATLVRFNSCKGELYPRKGPKMSQRAKWKFWVSKCYLGPNFWNLAPKGPTWQPCSQDADKTTYPICTSRSGNIRHRWGGG